MDFSTFVFGEIKIKKKANLFCCSYQIKICKNVSLLKNKKKFEF